MYNFIPEPRFCHLYYLWWNHICGIDNIAPVVLKNCAHALATPAHHLFTISIRSGSIPSEWKIHKITSVYKSGDKTSVTNYRPISLLCIMSKVLERLIYDKIISAVATSITPHQYGFQRGTSTLQQLPYAGNIWRGKILANTHFLNFWAVKNWRTYFSKLFGW